MPFLIVLLKHIAAEVILQVTPDEVGVVGVVLGVGVFDEEVFPLNTEVVFFASLKRASPCEVEVFALEGVNFAKLIGADVLALEAGDLVDEGEKLLHFFPGHFLGSDTLDFLRFCAAVLMAENLFNRFFRKDGAVSVLFESDRKISCGVLDLAEWAHSFEWAFFKFSGISAEEGREADDSVFHDGEV